MGVTTEEASPGMLTRMAGGEPPDCAPQEMTRGGVAGKGGNGSGRDQRDQEAEPLDRKAEQADAERNDDERQEAQPANRLAFNHERARHQDEAEDAQRTAEQHREIAGPHPSRAA